MRLIPILFLGLALVLAGCSKEDDTPDDGTTATTSTPPTTGGTTTTTTTPTTGGNSTGGGGNGTKTVTPVELCNAANTFTPDQMGAPTPPATSPSKSASCGTPAAGYTKINATVTWTTATPVPGSVSPANPTVTLLDSTATAVGSCAGPTGAVQAAVVCTIADAAIVPGEYTLRYDGAGNLKATISVMVF